jgi:hypothetical protein
MSRVLTDGLCSSLGLVSPFYNYYRRQPSRGRGRSHRSTLMRVG